jgi:hypothetical protein
LAVTRWSGKRVVNMCQRCRKASLVCRSDYRDLGRLVPLAIRQLQNSTYTTQHICPSWDRLWSAVPCRLRFAEHWSELRMRIRSDLVPCACNRRRTILCRCRLDGSGRTSSRGKHHDGDAMHELAISRRPCHRLTWYDVSVHIRRQLKASRGRGLARPYF